jgi:hypothetical protein
MKMIFFFFYLSVELLYDADNLFCFFNYIIGKMNNCPSMVIRSLREQSCWLNSKS